VTADIDSAAKTESEEIDMERRYNVKSWTGLAALACLLLIPGFAQAAGSCASITPSFSYTPVARTGGQATVGITTPPGCLWVVESHSPWIRIVSANRGYGNGVVVFQVLANPTARTRRGSFGEETRCVEPYLPTRSSISCKGFTVTVDQY